MPRRSPGAAVLAALLQSAKDIFFPSCCPGCGVREPGLPRPAFCPECRSRLRPADTLSVRRGGGPNVSRRIAACVYEGPMRDALRRFKFRGKSAYCAALAGEMAAAVRRAEPPVQADAVTYIPVSARRRRTRGYDQAALLAEALAEQLGLPCVRLLKKTGHNPPQSGLDAAARSANVVGVYRLARGARAGAGRRLLLVDDIFTTGATLREAAFVLAALGPASVTGVFAAETEFSGHIPPAK